MDSTLYPGQEREAWLVNYTDGYQEHFEEEELRSGKHGGVPAGQGGKPVLVVRDMPERKAICDVRGLGGWLVTGKVVVGQEVAYFEFRSKYCGK